MGRARTLVVVLAGGAGGRLELLTASRAKPAVPFGGRYRLIDFPLSNCVHSGLSDVWVIEQFNPVSLTDHLASGRPWDLDRTRGGLLVLHPRLGESREGWHSGTTDALWRNAPLIREYDPQAVVVVSADAVYKLDYADVVDGHLKSDASLTMVTTRVAAADAARYGVVVTDDRGAITHYAYKPDNPRSDLVATEVFVFSPVQLLDRLEQAAAQAGNDGLGDIGEDVLPHLVADGDAREHRFGGYWRDVGTVEAYWSAHMDLLADDPPIRLDDPAWPIYTAGGDRGPAWVQGTATVANALLAGGARVAGRVENSVLGAGVTIEPDATVRDAIILENTVVAAGAVVERAILDTGVRIGGRSRIGGRRPDAAGGTADDGITLIGAGQTIPSQATIEPGTRVPS